MVEKIHPATTVTNIKHTIPITLDHESRQYIAWSILFILHTKAHLVYDHIIPPTNPTAESTSKNVEAEKAL